MYDESSWPFLASATLGLAVILAGILGAWRAAHTLPWAEAEAWFTEQPTARQVGSWVIVVFLWLVVPLPLALLMLPILVVLGAWRLDILVMLAIASAPFFRYLRPVGGQGVALAEVLILVGMASLVVRGLTWGGHSLLGDMRAILARSRTHAVIFFVIVAILSLSASEDLHLSLRELRLVVVEPALLFLLAMMVCQRDDRGREKIVWALVGSGALAAGQSLVQWLITDEVVATEGVRRALGPYGSPNNLGLLLERLLPVALSAVLLPWRGRREIAMIAVVVMGLALALTFSVGAWGGALVGVVAWGVQQGWIRTLRRRPSLFLGLVMAIVVGGGVLLSVERISSHLAITGDTTAGRRVSLWQSSLAMLRDHAIRGVGLDGFLDLYRTQYIRPEAWREPDLSHPHNLVLEWWLFLGLPGLAALGWFLVFFMMQVRHPHDSIAYGVIASLAAATAHGLVDRFYFGAPDLAIIFMCLLVLVAPPDRA
jgi:O-antigen ligase